MLVVSDASDTVFLVVRKWAVAAGGGDEYTDLLHTIRELYGEGVTVAPPEEDNRNRRMTVWPFANHHLDLRYMPSDRTIYLEWRLGAPEAVTD